MRPTLRAISARLIVGHLDPEQAAGLLATVDARGTPVTFALAEPEGLRVSAAVPAGMAAETRHEPLRWGKLVLETVANETLASPRKEVCDAIVDSLRVAHRRLGVEGLDIMPHGSSGVGFCAAALVDGRVQLVIVPPSQVFVVHQGVALSVPQSEEAGRGIWMRDDLRAEIFAGIGGAHEPDIRVYDAGIVPGDALVLVSSGLARMLTEDDVRLAVAYEEAATGAERLKQLAIQRGVEAGIALVVEVAGSFDEPATDSPLSGPIVLGGIPRPALKLEMPPIGSIFSTARDWLLEAVDRTQATSRHLPAELDGDDEVDEEMLWPSRPQLGATWRQGPHANRISVSRHSQEEGRTEVGGAVSSGSRQPARPSASEPARSVAPATVPALGWPSRTPRASTTRAAGSDSPGQRLGRAWTAVRRAASPADSSDNSDSQRSRSNWPNARRSAPRAEEDDRPSSASSWRDTPTDSASAEEDAGHDRQSSASASPSPHRYTASGDGDRPRSLPAWPWRRNIPTSSHASRDSAGQSSESALRRARHAGGRNDYRHSAGSSSSASLSLGWRALAGERSERATPAERRWPGAASQQLLPALARTRGIVSQMLAGAARRVAAFDFTAKRQFLVPGLAMVFTLLVFLVAVRTIKGEQARQIQQRLDSLVTAAGQLEGQARIDADHNEAQGLIRRAQALLDQAATLQPNQPRVAAVRQELQADLDRMDGVVALPRPAVLANFGSVAKGANMTAIAADGSAFYGLDGGGQHLLQVIRQSSQPSIAASKGDKSGANQLGALKLLTVRDGGALVLDSNRTLWSYSASKPKLEQIGLKSAETWKAATAMSAYGPNLYVLDATLGNVFRYASRGGIFTDAPTQFFEKDNPDLLRQSVSLAIDGAIWVVTADGQILKLEAGSGQPLAVTGLSQPLGKASQIATQAGFSSLYVLNAAGNRVFEIGKDGRYIRQFSLALPSPATSIWPDQPARQMAVLSGNSLYQYQLPT